MFILAQRGDPMPLWFPVLFAGMWLTVSFLDPRTIPNIIDDLIDDHLPPLAYARFKRMLERNRKK